MEFAPAVEGWRGTALRSTASQNAASRIQVRIAYCLGALGRLDESRSALEYALELNPDNLRARLELGRLE